MTLRKIWTTQSLRFGRAAYAESFDINIAAVLTDIAMLMAESGARFYKVEIKENGAYVGYFIITSGQVMKYYIRPHFSDLSTAFFTLIAEVQANANYTATIGSDNLKTV